VYPASAFKTPDPIVPRGVGMKEAEGRFVGIDLAKRSYVARLEPKAQEGDDPRRTYRREGIRKLCSALGRETG